MADLAVVRETAELRVGTTVTEDDTLVEVLARLVPPGPVLDLARARAMLDALGGLSARGFAIRPEDGWAVGEKRVPADEAEDECRAVLALFAAHSF